MATDVYQKNRIRYLPCPSSTKILEGFFSIVTDIGLPWVPEGYFFRNEAAIVSGKSRDRDFAEREKKRFSLGRITIAASPPTIAALLRKKTLWHPG